MTIRNILTMLEGANSDVVDLAAVGALAKSFSAHVDLLHVRRDPRSVMPIVGEGMSAELIDMVQSQVAVEEQAIADRCRSVFDRWCVSAKVQQIAEPSADARSTGRLVDVTGDAATVVALLGKMADLTVLPSPSLDQGRLSPVTEAALYDTGRPVLFSPRENLKTLGSRVAVFWNDTVEASRALQAAMPFLANADDVRIIAANDDTANTEMLTAVAASLAWHGVRASANLVEPGSRSIAEALLDSAWEFNADMIVMGAFSHSRLREIILGGVTQHILNVAGRPVLMMH